MVKKTPKKKTTAQLKKILWGFCKQIIRIKYKHCYTCPKQNLIGCDAQSGHGKPKGALPLKYQFDLRNIRLQCFHDNINLGGCSDIFIVKLEKEKEGKQFLKEACVKVDGHWEVKYGAPMGSIEAWMFVTNKIEEYKGILSDLTKEQIRCSPQLSF